MRSKVLRIRRLSAIVLLIPALVACQAPGGANPAEPAASAASEPPPGFYYFLPRTIVTATITQQLVECNVEPSGKDEAVFRFALKSQIQITSRTAADPAQEHFLPLSDVQKAMKSTDATFELYDDNGTLKSLNVQSADKTADVIGNILGSILKVASLAVPGISAKFASEKEKQPTLAKLRADYCGREAIRSLDQIAALTATMQNPKTTAAASAAAAQKIGDIQAAGLTRKIVLRLDPKLAPTVQSAETASARAQERIAAWTPDAAAVHKWITAQGVDKLAQQGEAFATLQDGTRLPADMAFELYARIPASTAGRATQHVAPNGLYYRQPVESEVMVCRGACLDASGKAVGDSDQLASANVVLPQLGHIVSLPITAGLFGDQTIGFAFNPSGAVTKVTIKSASTAANATAAVNSALGQLTAYKAAKEEAKEKEEKKDPPDVADMKRETARLQAQKALLDAQAGLAHPPKDEFNTTDIDAQKKYYDSLKALSDAKKSYDATTAK